MVMGERLVDQGFNIVLGEPSDSIGHHSSSQLPPEGEVQRWTVGD
jgi:hypothetical protein